MADINCSFLDLHILLLKYGAFTFLIALLSRFGGFVNPSTSNENHELSVP